MQDLTSLRFDPNIKTQGPAEVGRPRAGCHDHSVCRYKFALYVYSDNSIARMTQSSGSGELPGAGFERGAEQSHPKAFPRNAGCAAQINAGQRGIEIRKKLPRTTRLEQTDLTHLFDSAIQIFL